MSKDLEVWERGIAVAASKPDMQIASTEQELVELLWRVEYVSNLVGLSINKSKTKVLRESLQRLVKVIDRAVLDIVIEFAYLGSMNNDQISNDKEIKRTQIAKAVMRQDIDNKFERVKMEVNQEETETDVNWFNSKPSNSSQPNNNEEDETDRALPPRVQFNKFDLYYDMTGDKYLVIFNHRTFEKTRYFEFKRPPERNNTEKDVKSLENTFKTLGFETIVHNNLSHVGILEKMSEVCQQDHRSTSCIVVAIMSHGDDGSVFAADRPYRLSDVTNILHHCQGLVGKPKLLFVQACRGNNMDDGRHVQTDGGESIVLPTHADTLIMLSSADQHFAYRDANGSWLMQSLCEVLNERYQSFDLLQIITLVHQAVAYRSTYTRSTDTTNKKMMPETKFTLTKLLKF